MEQTQIHGINNIDKQPFLSNEQTINHQPDKFELDFRSVFPQFQGNQQIMVISHRVILLDTFQAKEFLRVLKDNIDKYEQKFGKIEKPKNVIKAEKEMNKLQKEAATTTERPDYMG